MSSGSSSVSSFSGVVDEDPPLNGFWGFFF